MYSIVFLIILKICTLIKAGYLVQGDPKLSNQNILQKYFQPLQRLIKDLPHHDVEIQLELVGTTPYPGIFAPQRRFRVKGLPKKRRKYRRQHENEVTVFQTPDSNSTTEASTIIASTTIASTTASSTTATSTTTASTIEAAKKPVYMEDLKKAMNEFERKIRGKNKDSEPDDDNQPLLKKHLFEALGCKGHKHKEEQHKESHVKPPPTDVFNVDSILSLLQKGIEVKRDVPTPNDDNLHWMQIKVPKGLDIHV